MLLSYGPPFRSAEGYVAEQDQLLFVGDDNIRSIFDGSTGTLFLLSEPTGSAATAASFQNVLRRVTYRNTNDLNPAVAPRTITLEVLDELGQSSNVASVSLSVSLRNDAPVVALQGGAPLDYTPDAGGGMVIFPGLLVSDPDGDMLTGAQVTIREGFGRSEDRLFIIATGSPNIVAVVSNNLRTITFSGTDTPEAYQTALRSVQFGNSPPDGVNTTPGNRRIEATVDDGRGSASIARFVVLNSPDVPPVVKEVALDVPVNTATSFSAGAFTAQYEDAETPALSGVYIRSKPQYGALLFQGAVIENSDINANPDGFFVATADIPNLAYQSESDFTGTDSFLWNAQDATGFAASNATVTLNVVLPPLTLSLASLDPISTPEDTEVALPAIELTNNSNQTVTTTLTVSNGTISLAPAIVPLLSFSSGDGTDDASLVFSGLADAVAYALNGLRYTPNQNYSGTDNLSINLSAAGDVRAQTTLAIEVVPENDPIRLSNIETEPIRYVENAPPVQLTNQIVVENLDNGTNTQIASATITITEGFVAGEDILLPPSLSNIEGQQEGNVLTLSGANNIGVYEAALQNVQYQNVSDNPSANKTVSFVLRDANDATSNIVSRNIVIEPVEDPISIVGLEDSPINYVVENEFTTISNSVRVIDPDTEVLDRMVIAFTEGYDPAFDSLYLEVDATDLTVAWDDAQGILTVSGAGTPDAYTQTLRRVRYQNTSSAENDQPRTLSIQVFQGENASNIVTRSVVLIINDPPVVEDFAVDAATNAPYSFTLEEFVTRYNDPDNSPAGSLTEIRINSLPENGVLVFRGDTLRPADVEGALGGLVISDTLLTEGALQYISVPGFTGTDAFQWNAFDGAELALENATVQINVQDILVIDVVATSEPICPGTTDSLSVNVVAGPAEVSYLWSCEGDCGFAGTTDSSTVFVTPRQTTVYTVLATSGDGTQTAQDSVTISIATDCPEVTLDVPSAFTPNGDQQNDTWVVPESATLGPFVVEIFDRYGHSLYTSDSYQNDWAGEYEGEPLPTGAYYYLITDAEGQSYRGTLNILR